MGSNGTQRQERLEELLEASTNDRQSGIAIFLDIVDSTRRKKTIPSWKKQTEYVYGMFDAMAEGQHKRLENRRASRSHFVLKHIGDGLFAFHGLGFLSPKALREDSTIREFCIDVLNEVWDFKEKIATNDKLDRMTLKSIITCSSEVAIYPDIGTPKGTEGGALPRPEPTPGRGESSDVLGNDIDLVFRLEKFGDSGHLVMNDQFKALVETEIALKNLTAIEVRRYLKGFDEPQKFWAVADPDTLRRTYEGKVPSEHADHIYLELIKEILKSTGPSRTSSVPQDFKKPTEGGKE